MTVAGLAGAVARRGRVRSRTTPELAAALAVGAAWLLLVVLHAPGPLHGGGVHHPGHEHGVPAPAGGATGLAAVALGLPAWVLMTVAMMGRPALPAVRHVSVNSLCWRRGRAVAAFAAAYAVVWVAFGAVAIVAVSWWAPSRRTPLLALVLAVAALWQLTRWKRLALLNGHRAVPLPARGLRATVADVRFGLRYGAACVGSCWAMMLVMAVATSGHLAWTAALAAVVTAEKTLPRPRRTSRVVAYLLGATALATAVLALV